MRLFLLFIFCLLFANASHARLEVCNQTDLVLMVAVGYDTAEERVASEGWWRIYPGFCQVPVDVTLVKGSYYLHAESNPRSTKPNDAFVWGEENTLCVELNDFRNPDAVSCSADKVRIKFNRVDKNWRNTNKVNIYHGRRTYKNQFRVKIAGVQRMLSILGYEIGEIDGQIGEKTVTALNQVGLANSMFGFDFQKVFPLLEEILAQRQKLDN